VAMAFRRYDSWNQPPKDTGWGLIFRLNRILDKVEYDVEQGDLSRWNLHLDRIYSNILYRNEEELVKDNKDNIQKINFSKEDTEVFTKFNSEIEKIQKELSQAKQVEDEQEKIKQVNEASRKYYAVLFKKDIWIRKKMFQMKLYLREHEADPRQAIYGG
jgi:hypothetical protein